MKKVYVLAIAIAIIAGISVYIFASSLQTSKEDLVVKGTVVYALTDIPTNTLITMDMVALVEIDATFVHPRSIVTLEEVVGKITTMPIYAQEQVLQSRLEAAGEDSSKLSYTLQNGHRAISVAVDSVSGVSGHIMANDFVDVVAILLIPGEQGMPAQPVSMLLVENLLVLETGLKQPAATDNAGDTFNLWTQ